MTHYNYTINLPGASAPKLKIRPTRVTYVSRFLIVSMIVTGTYTGLLITELGLVNQPLLLLSLINAIIFIISAVFMLKAQNWARWLYILWVIMGPVLILNVDFHASVILLYQSTHLVFFILLLTKPSNEYFYKLGFKQKENELSGCTSQIIIGFFSLYHVVFLLFCMLIFMLESSSGFHI